MRKPGVIVLLVGLMLSLGGTAWAAGFYLYEYGTPDVGLASAGYAARAQDAGTLFTNPAGMTRLEKTEILSGVQVLYGDATFSPNQNTSVPGGGGDGGNAIGWLPGGSLFLVSQPAPESLPNLRLGLGLLSYFGSALRYDDDWAGRYYLQKAALLGFSLMPTVAYKFTDWLSVGAGLNAMYGYLNSQVAVNNVLDSLPDGQMKLKDETWGFGGNAGVLLEPWKGTRFGLTWLSQVKLDFKDAPQFSNLGPGLTAVLNKTGLLTSQIGLGMTLPNRIMLGAFHQLNDRWALMGDVGWEQWSQFGKVEVTIDSANPTSLTKTVNYQDTWHLAVGAQYRPVKPWVLSAGFGYDSSMLHDQDRTIATPVGQAFRFGIGGQYAIRQNLKLGLDYTLLWGGNLSVDQSRGPLAGRVAGEFKNAYINFVALNLCWVF